MLSQLGFTVHRRISTLRWKPHLRSPRRSVQTGQNDPSKSQLYTARRESRFNFTLLVVGFIPIFTFGLGTWQLQRLKWKIALIDELGEKLQREPLSLPGQINLAAVPDFVYRKVLLRGKWDHTRSMLLGPRVRDGIIGFHVVTPLVRSDGSTVLVDRGFVSKDIVKNSAIDKIQENEVEVLGMLRTSQTRNHFTPDNKPEEGIWHWADVDSMAQFAGGQVAGVQPVFVEEIFEGHSGDAATRITHGIPVGRPPTVDLRNAHFSYVVTWYSLSTFTAFMFVRLLMKKRLSAIRQLPR